MLAKNTHHKYRKYRKNNKCNKIPDLERKEAERFQRAKNILVTFAIFADISGFFLASSFSKSATFVTQSFRLARKIPVSKS